MSIYRKLGLVELPLGTSFGHTLRDVADPMKATLTNFLKTALTAEIADVIEAFEGTIDDFDFDGYVVRQVIDFPSARAFLGSEHLGFPLLAVYRQTNRKQEFAIGTDSKITNWRVEYALPSLSTYDEVRVSALLNAVDNVIQHVIYHNYHPAYNDGYTVFNPDVVAIRVVNSELGIWDLPTSNNDAIVYPACVVNLESIELESDIAVYDSFDGFEMIVDGTDGYGEPGDEYPELAHVIVDDED